jgi:hypothetical protein
MSYRQHSITQIDFCFGFSDFDAFTFVAQHVPKCTA